ncbi:phosphate/phosphite/phosphonate ABC transporter substrate-binding protein [Rubrivivax sp. RP6-9]|uniref:phosphate/phosphite/phosphonate ABC transporter substrate-binding protein n=1 Tax=Rubrivivax sp. RP6-9 TaxID=3415750 RepID=UPI003CC68B90
MTTRRASLAWLGTGWALAGAATAQRPPLRIALAPFLSPAALLAVFRPLREHLEHALQRPVEMVTSRDFHSLVGEARRGEHDVVQLPAHLARLAMLDWRYQMLAGPDERVEVVVGVRGAGPVRSIGDLRGQRVGMLDALSLTATVGRAWLQAQGLDGAVTVVAQPSVNAALYALERGEIGAFVAADTQLATLPASTPRGERVLVRIGGIPGPLFLARHDLPAAEREDLRAALLAFQPDPARPRAASNAPLRPVPAASMAALDAYVVVARQLLAQGAR